MGPTGFMSEPEITERIFRHIDARTTDLCDDTWREPVDNYRSKSRFDSELALMRRTPTAFCPSAALHGPGSFLSRHAALTPILAVRGADGVVRAFRNACRHRGAPVACGAGRNDNFVCPYHGWTYGLNGELRGVPHEHGFPDLDKPSRGLVPVHAVEKEGLVFITQEMPGEVAQPYAPEGVFGPTLRLVESAEREARANWKISAEGFLEGYHIAVTHRDTFYPAQFNNLTVVEHLGLHSRVTFPFRNIERLRVVPPRERRTDGVVTHVYHLFPNVILATLPKRLLMVVLEPVDLRFTRYHRYTLARAEDLATDRSRIDKGISLGAQGEAEDRAIIASIQSSLDGGGNEYFEFGRFEGAIAHFHRNLHRELAAMSGA